MKQLLTILTFFSICSLSKAQTWAVSLIAKKEIESTPYGNGNNSSEKHVHYQIGVDRIFNKYFGVNASISNVYLKNAYSLGQSIYQDTTFTLNVRNKITTNVFQLKIGPFFYLQKGKSQFSIRPYIGLGFVKTNQTIFNSVRTKQYRETFSEDYSYKNEVLPSYGISLNYNYFLSKTWSVGVSLGAETMTSQTTKYKIKTTNEQPLSRFPIEFNNNVIEAREERYKQFGDFSFLQIGFELKKYF